MTEELYSVLQQLKAGKAPGTNNICSELILHDSDKLKAWLRNILSPACATSGSTRSGGEP